MYILNRIPITTLFLSWDFLERYFQGNVKDQVDLIITDIEMPLMDGHHLTEKIKKNSVLNDIPIIIFSSLISADLFHKGKAVGANAQVAKPEIVTLVEKMDRLLAD